MWSHDWVRIVLFCILSCFVVLVCIVSFMSCCTVLHRIVLHQCLLLRIVLCRTTSCRIAFLFQAMVQITTAANELTKRGTNGSGRIRRYKLERPSRPLPTIALSRTIMNNVWCLIYRCQSVVVYPATSTVIHARTFFRHCLLNACLNLCSACLQPHVQAAFDESKCECRWRCGSLLPVVEACSSLARILKECSTSHFPPTLPPHPRFHPTHASFSFCLTFFLFGIGDQFAHTNSTF